MPHIITVVVFEHELLSFKSLLIVFVSLHVFVYLFIFALVAFRRDRSIRDMYEQRFHPDRSVRAALHLPVFTYYSHTHAHTSASPPAKKTPHKRDSENSNNTNPLNFCSNASGCCCFFSIPN